MPAPPMYNSPATPTGSLPGNRRRLQDVALRFAQAVDQSLRLARFVAAGEDQASAGNQRKVQLELGNVEGKRRHCEQGIGGGESGLTLHGEQQVDHRAVKDLHALRLPR